MMRATARTRFADPSPALWRPSDRFGARDLRDHNDRAADPRSGDLRHLREQGLIQTVRLDGRRDVAVVLTDRGGDLLESHRDRDQEPRQAFYSRLKREREVEQRLAGLPRVRSRGGARRADRSVVVPMSDGEFRACLQRHADLLRALPGWSQRLVVARDAANRVTHSESAARGSQILPLSYRHLAPLVTLHSAAEGVEEGERTSARPQPPRRHRSSKSNRSRMTDTARRMCLDAAAAHAVGARCGMSGGALSAAAVGDGESVFDVVVRRLVRNSGGGCSRVIRGKNEARNCWLIRLHRPRWRRRADVVRFSRGGVGLLRWQPSAADGC